MLRESKHTICNIILLYIMSQEIPNIPGNNQEILNDIQSLQGIEQNLFNSLENPNLTSEEQESTINKINRISEMRINLYKTLTGVNSFFQQALTSSRGTLTEQTAAIGVIEDELNQAKKRLRELEQEKNNKIRLVEINNYYSQQYEEYSNLMKLVIFILIPIILLTLLKQTGLLPYNWYYIFVAIVLVIGAIFSLRLVWSIANRDTMNYQEYDWYFDKASAPKSNGLTNDDPWAGGRIGACMGQYCCSEGQIYDTSLNQCIGNSTVMVSSTAALAPVSAPALAPDTSIPPVTQEGFINSVLTMGSRNYKKPDVTLSNMVEPFGGGGFLNFPKM